MEWCLQGKTEVPGENLSHCQLLYDKSQIEWPGIKSRPPRSVSSDLKARWRKKRKDDGQNLDIGKCVEEKIWNCDRERDGSTHKVIPCSKVLPEKLFIPQTDKLSQIIKPTGSLPYPQQPANCTYPKADQFSPRPPPHQPISRRSHLIASYHLLLGLPTKTAYHFSSACPPPTRFYHSNNLWSAAGLYIMQLLINSAWTVLTFVSVHSCHKSDQIKQDEIHRTCSMHKMWNVYNILDGKRATERSMRTSRLT